MPSYVTPKKGVAFVIFISLPSIASPGLMQSNPTLASGDFKVSIDGGTLANLATLPTVTPASGKMVQVSLSTSEMNGDNITVVCSDAAGAQWGDVVFNIQTSARQIDDLAYPATSGRSMVVDASGLVDANTVKVGPTGSGTAQTAGDIPARLPAALVSGRMDASVGAMAANVMTAAAAASDLTTELQTGLATASALSTLTGYVDTEVAAILAAVDTEVAAIKAKTDNLPSDPADASDIAAAFAALSIPSAAANAAALLAAAFEGAETVQDFLRLSRAALYGEVSGAATTTMNFRDKADAKDRITATVDADGNRTALTLDPS